MKKVLAGLIVVITLLLLYYILTPTEFKSIVGQDGYAIANASITKNLLKEKVEDEDKVINTLPVSAYDKIISKSNSLFLDDYIDKQKLNEEYPIFVNEGIGIFNLSSENVLIDNKLNTHEAYPFFTLTNGELFNNNDFTRADDNKYILLMLENNMFINSIPLTIKNYQTNFLLPINSIINLGENAIRYYYYNDTKLIFNEIQGIDNDSIIIIDDEEINYYKLLITLGLMEEKIDNKKEEEEILLPPSSPTIDYVKPLVTIDEFDVNVYSMTSKISIKDKSGVIASSITVTVKKGSETYLRRSFSSAGDVEIRGLEPNEEYEVVVTYKYRNENNSLIESTILKQKITTKGLNELPPLTFSFENGDVHSDKLIIRDIKITDGLNSETIKGLKKISVMVDGREYSLTTAQIKALLNDETVDFETNGDIKSNQYYRYIIKAYDGFYNELVINNNAGSSRTSKANPIAKIKVVDTSIKKTDLRIDIENADSVNLIDIKYAIYDDANNIIANDKTFDDDLITLTKLNANKLYRCEVYATYDNMDGRGTKENQLIGSTIFTTMPILNLGYLRLNLIKENITTNSATFEIEIDSSTIESVLVELLDNFNFKITDEEGNSISNYTLSEEDIENLKLGNKTYLTINNLLSNTIYKFTVDTIIHHGTLSYTLRTLINIDKFQTNKLPTQIVVKNRFVTENMIDFDVMVYDIDNAVRSNRIILEVRNEKGDLVYNSNLSINGGYQRITLEKLDPEKKYRFAYIAEEYNIGSDNTTYEDNKKLFEETIDTVVGISGKIDLINLTEVTVGRNYFDINNAKKWRSQNNSATIQGPRTINTSNNSVTISAYNGWVTHSYYLPDLIGKPVTISFQAKYETGANYRQQPVYLANTYASSTATRINNLTTEYKDYQYTITVNSYGYVGFYIAETTDSNMTTSITIKNLQVELGKVKTEYENFVSEADYLAKLRVNLKDLREEIPNNDYYLREYKNEQLVNTYHYEIGSNILPSEYTEVEYITIKNDTQNGSMNSINTLVPFNEAKKLEFKYKSSDTQRYIIFVSGYSTATKRVSPWVGANTGNLTTSGFTTASILPVNTKRNVLSDGTIRTVNLDFTSSSTAPIAFGGWQDTNYSRTIDWYSFKLWDSSNELLRDFIPVIRNSDGMIGMYDMIEKSFYTNQGLGTFESGPVVTNKEVEIVEVIDKYLEYHVKRSSNYSYVLQVKINDRFYDITKTSFDTGEEIRSISTIYDFQYMSPTGKYIVLNDLDFRNKNVYYSSYFSGKIDFQGYTVMINTIGRSNYLLYGTTTSALIENLVLNVHMDNPAAKTYWYNFTVYSYGTYDNLIVNLVESTDVNNWYIGLFGHTNYGTVNNFIVNMQEPLHTYGYTSALFQWNYGTIKNGYFIGENIDATKTNIYNGPKYVGVVSAINYAGGYIKNVYSLVGVDTGVLAQYNESYVGSIISYSSNGIVENVYTVAGGENRISTIDANIGVYSSGTIRNSYYYSNITFSNKNSSKISKIALYDPIFQNNTINSENAFELDLSNKIFYFPHLKMSEFMPNQEYIEIPKVDDEDLIDITSATVVENNGDEVILDIRVNNPALQQIASIGIEYVKVEILSQTNGKGYSTIRARVYDPVYCYSKYDVTSIAALGPYNSVEPRNYSDNERPIAFDMYHPITTVSEWLNIKKKLKENHMLMNDLDFNLITGSYNISGFYGKINGNNHTIKNINIRDTTGMFYSLYGSIKNLFIENYTQNVNASYIGFISTANQGSIIDNVHMKNVTVLSANYTSALVAYGNGTTIINSSVSNYKVLPNNNTYYAIIGSIASYVTTSIIENCFAKDLDLDTTEIPFTYALGGIVGQNVSYSNITNVYTTGKIKTSSSNVGGIVGLISSGEVKQAYTYVFIDAKLDYVGGIAGRGGNSTSNTMVFGSLYTSYYYTYTQITSGNASIYSTSFVWDKSLFNGYDVELSSVGETKINSAQIKERGVYEERIGLGDSFYYDEVSDGYLPKLYNNNGIDLLPNQDNITPIIDEELLINSIEYDELNKNNIVFIIDNPNEYVIDSIEFDYLNVTSIRRNATSNGITQMELQVVANKALDSYKLTKINYRENGVSKSIDKQIRIELQFFKNLTTESWQAIDSNVPENYLLKGDIDFTNAVNIKHDVIINRIEGDEDTSYSIKGFTINSDKMYTGLIKRVNSEIRNVTFEDITVTSSLSSGQYMGVIAISYAKIDNVSFKNINVSNAKFNYVGSIGYNLGTNISNVSLSDIAVNGYLYVGGFIGNTNPENINGVTATRVNASGYQRTGGIIGYSQSSSLQHEHFSIDTAEITGRSSYTGGVFGYGDARYSDATNVTVIGAGYVGGLSGYGGVGSCYYNTVTDSSVTGTNSYVGGVYGNSTTKYYTTARNITINGVSYVGGITGSASVYYSTANDMTIITTGSYTGGIVGSGGAYYSGVYDSNITSTGSYVGGLTGNGSAGYSFVANTPIIGKNYVGGVTGIISSPSASLYYNVTSANVTATNVGAGGLLGYFNNDNKELDNARVYYNIVANPIVVANNYASGLIGYSNKELLPAKVYSNIVYATAYTTDEYTVATPFLGNSNSFVPTTSNIKIYENSLINDTKVKDIIGVNIEPHQLLTRDDLLLQTTYTSIGMSASYFKYNFLADEYFPKTAYNLSVQPSIPIPSEETGLLGSFRRFGHMLMPDVDIYSSGIDTINIEFNNTNERMYFNIETDGIKSEETPITKKTFTFKYDYKTTFKLNIHDSINEANYTITPKDVIKTATVTKDNYFYLDNGTIKSNIKNFKGEFIHLYDFYAIDKSGFITNLLTQTKTNSIKGIEEVETRPLYKFEIDGKTIDTYYNYSIVTNENNAEEKPYQIFVKNNELSIISKTVDNDKTGLILDYYNGKYYETVLGNDGSIYNLKEPIKVPNDFKNKKIVEITSNVSNNSSFVIVCYEDGSIYGFDYKTGKKLFNDVITEEKDMNILEYIMSKLSKNSNEVTFNEEYETAKELTKELNAKSIEEILNNIPTNNNTKYITVYNEAKEDYDIYDKEEVLNEKNTLSKTDKIYSNIELMNYYYNANSSSKTFSINGIYILIGIMIFIATTIIIWGKNLIKIKD